MNRVIINLDKLLEEQNIEPSQRRLGAMSFMGYVSQRLGVELPYEFPDAEGDERESFIVKMNDINAPGAIKGYALEANKNGDPDLAHEILDKLNRAGHASKFFKKSE